jgi:hypothetical protein
MPTQKSSFSQAGLNSLSQPTQNGGFLSAPNNSRLQVKITNSWSTKSAFAIKLATETGMVKALKHLFAFTFASTPL